MKKMILASAALISMSAFSQNNTTTTATQAATSSTASTVAAPAAQASTTSAAEVKPEATKKWGLELTTLSDASTGNSFSNGRIQTDGYVALKYKLDDVNRLALRGYFRHIKQAVDSSEENKITGETLMPVYGRAMGSVAGSNPSDLQVRYTLPISKEIQSVANNGVIKLVYDITWDITPKFQIEYAVCPKFRLNTQSEKNNIGLSEHYASFIYNMNDKFGIYQAVGTSTSNLYDIANTGAYLETGLNLTASKNFILNMNLNQTHNIGPGAKEFTYLDSNESVYEVVLSLLY